MSYTSQLNGGPRRLMVVDGAVSDDAWHNVTITVSGKFVETRSAVYMCVSTSVAHDNLHAPFCKTASSKFLLWLFHA
jgi:hypothetical protein